MSAGCVRWVLNRAGRAVCGVTSGFRTPASRFPKCTERSNIVAASWSWSPFSTAVDDTQQTPPPNRKKEDPRTPTLITNAGYRIPERLIEVISDTGEELGTMHRAVAIKLMEKQGLKLVLLNDAKIPPVYQLMSGKQLFQEQLKLRKKQKAKPATVQVKELTLSRGIASHDLITKLKQVENWLEKKNHVRLTLRLERNAPAVDPVMTLEQMIQKMEVMVGFVSQPQVKGGGRAATCVLRLATAKEIAKMKKKESAPSQPVSSAPEDAQGDASPVSATDTTEGPVQQ